MRSSKAAIRRAILAYLARNPEADDTVEGIAEWWLRLQRIVAASVHPIEIARSFA